MHILPASYDQQLSDQFVQEKFYYYCKTDIDHNLVFYILNLYINPIFQTIFVTFSIS